MAKKGYTTIELFQDSGKYKDDLVVGYNGTFYQIKRGEPVDVPIPVAEIIEQSLQQQKQTARFIRNQTEYFANEVDPNL